MGWGCNNAHPRRTTWTLRLDFLTYLPACDRHRWRASNDDGVSRGVCEESTWGLSDQRYLLDFWLFVPSLAYPWVRLSKPGPTVRAMQAGLFPLPVVLSLANDGTLSSRAPGRL